MIFRLCWFEYLQTYAAAAWRHLNNLGKVTEQMKTFFSCIGMIPVHMIPARLDDRNSACLDLYFLSIYTSNASHLNFTEPFLVLQIKLKKKCNLTLAMCPTGGRLQNSMPFWGAIYYIGIHAYMYTWNFRPRLLQLMNLPWGQHVGPSVGYLDENYTL